jgi:hypothetical protein
VSDAFSAALNAGSETRVDRLHSEPAQITDEVRLPMPALADVPLADIGIKRLQTDALPVRPPAPMCETVQRSAPRDSKQTYDSAGHQ